MESAGGEEANRRKRLAVEDDVHQHQLDSHHPSHGTCTHARPSDGNLEATLTLSSSFMHDYMISTKLIHTWSSLTQVLQSVTVFD